VQKKENSERERIEKIRKEENRKKNKSSGGLEPRS
jgi:hypothetical protein